MSDMENIGRMHGSKNIVKELMDAAQRMIVCENEVNKATEKIIKSCNTQGTRGADHRSFLLTKIAGLKRLATLYRSMSNKYENTVVKLADGMPEDKTMAELDSYNVFINDQIKSEHECYEQVLRMLRS